MWRLIPHVVPGKQKRPLSVVRSQIFHFASTDQAGICFSQGSLFAFTRWLDPCVLFTEVQVAWGDPSTLTIALPVYLRVACLCICKFVFLCICASHSAPSPLTTALLRICRPGQVVEVWGALARLMAAHYHNNWPGHSSHNNWGPGCWWEGRWWWWHPICATHTASLPVCHPTSLQPAPTHMPSRTFYSALCSFALFCFSIKIVHGNVILGKGPKNS